MGYLLFGLLWQITNFSPNFQWISKFLVSVGRPDSDLSVGFGIFEIGRHLVL